MPNSVNGTSESQESVLVPLVVSLLAGYPTSASTVPFMLALERGGAEVIDLQIPFKDADAEDREEHLVAIEQGVDYFKCLKMVLEANEKGLKVAVVLSTHFHPLLSHVPELAVVDAKDAGATGIIILDLPPEETVHFRQICAREEISYIPTVTPSTTDERIRELGCIVDTFMLAKSLLPPPSDKTAPLPPPLITFLTRVRSLLPHHIALTVFFDVSSRSQLDEIGGYCDAVVVASRVREILKKHGGDDVETAALALEGYCAGIVKNLDTRSSVSSSTRVDLRIEGIDKAVQT